MFGPAVAKTKRARGMIDMAERQPPLAAVVAHRRLFCLLLALLLISTF